MTFLLLTQTDERWEAVAQYAEACTWSAGRSLAGLMRSGAFGKWERVSAAHEDEKICGFCTVTEKDCIPDLPYTPYIGYVFVDEAYRGQRLSERMIGFAMEYLRRIGFAEAYLISDHENLYEKYGFSVLEHAMAPWGSMEKVYYQAL